MFIVHKILSHVKVNSFNFFLSFIYTSGLTEGRGDVAPSEVSLALSKAIKNPVESPTSSIEKISGDLVVEKISYLTESTIGSKGEVILGPKLDIILKSEYTISNQLFLEPCHDLSLLKP